MMPGLVIGEKPREKRKTKHLLFWVTTGTVISVLAAAAMSTTIKDVCTTVYS